ncbi:MAG: glycosyltransferase family 2 protein [Nitrospirae bacterium]|nr:glycosyltransferase family 2 protein [Nitrospirota bacterium]
MSGRPSISVIIVNYNGKHLLPECLDSLRDQTLRDFEVVVVDNNSDDGSLALLEASYPEVTVVRNRSNLGYGGGNNAGIAVSKGRYVVLLNNDATADPQWLGELVRAAEKSEGVGMCASKILNYYDRGMIDNTGLLIYRDGVARGRGRLERDTGQYQKQEEVFVPSGCAGLYKREVFEEIGLFDEDFFLYVDDVDIGLRARLAGWSCVYAPSAIVYHKYSATADPYSPLKAFLVERNRIWVVMKCFPLRMLLTSPLYTLLRYIMQAYGMLTGKGAGSRFVKTGSVLQGLLVLVRAYAAAFGGARGMFSKRRAIMMKKKVENSNISLWFTRFGISARELALKE